MSSSRLMRTLNVMTGGGELTENLEVVRKNVKPLLAKITEVFPEYTTHDISHSEAVIENLDLIIPETLEKKLNIYEIYFLIAAAYLHDIGMIDFPSLDNEELRNFRESKEAVRTFIRENHHLRTEQFILNEFKDIGLRDHHQAAIIGRICRGHRRENLHDGAVFSPSKIYKRKPINVVLLAGFLRIADELDVTFERAPLIVFEHVTPKHPISKEEWEKHLLISGAATNPSDVSVIKCSATCKNHNIHRALKSLETKINQELDELPNHLHHYVQFRRDLPKKFFMEIEAVGYKAHDLKFSLQENEIVNLLMGERLYEHKEESLRELLKNSVDSCRLRREQLKKEGLTVAPKITFELNKSKDRITVSDNGAGMDEDIIERYLTKIGRSFYHSTEFLNQKFDFAPLSELGIGILSCFMIADKVIIETKTDSSQPLLVEIDDVSDYFLVMPGSRELPGSSVTLCLKKELIGKIDLYKEIRNFARHLEFPVTVILSDEQEKQIDDEDYETEIREVSAGRPDPEAWDVYVIKVDKETVEGSVALLLQRDDTLRFKIPSKLAYFGIIPSAKQAVLSYEGVFVGHRDILPPCFRSELLFFDLNVRRKALDLNAARNNLVENAKSHDLRMDLEKTLVKSLQTFLATFARRAKEAGIPSEPLLNEFFYTFVKDFDALDALLKKHIMTNEFLSFFKRYYNYRCISDGVEKFMRYNQLVRSHKPNTILVDLDVYAQEHIEEMCRGCSALKENELYIIWTQEAGNPTTFLFGDIQVRDFISYFDIIPYMELGSVLPRSWRLGWFRNYHTQRFIEFRHQGLTMLNLQNRFLELLTRNKRMIRGDKEMALRDFFYSFPRDLDRNFPRVIAKQKEILKWFVDAQIIQESQVNEFVLTSEDFPPHLFGWTYLGY